jgi:hypothetical protein
MTSGPQSEFQPNLAGAFYHGRRWISEETANPFYADTRNFYKVEKCTRDGSKVDALLYAGNNLRKAQEIFATAIKRRPRIRLTIRQRTRVLQSEA